MEIKHIIVFITAPSKEVGRQIAETLLEKKLAACVNAITPVDSLYTWKGETVEDHEVLLIVKARADGFEERLIPAVRAVHPYEVPEIIALPIIKGLGSYLEWIDAVTDEEGK